MAYCHGPESPYGCGHTHEHIRTAKLGWLHRLRGRSFEGSTAQRHLERVTGRVELAHTHRSHPGKVLFRKGSTRKWYELPTREFRALVRAGKEDEEQEQREAREREREEAKERRDTERAQALIAREREKEAARRRVDQERAERERQRQEHRAERERTSQERLARGVARAEYNDVARTIRQAGGIHVSREAATGRTHGRGEIEAAVPSSLRARKGEGAWANGERIRVSSCSNMSEAFLMHSGLNLFRAAGYWKGFERLVDATSRQRGFGDYFGYCVVAAGKGEIYVEAELKPWDVAPMKILVEEAGGRLTDFAGKPDIYSGSVLATNGRLHDEALRLLTSGR